MKVLVTGAKGFIGKNLVSHLSECDDVDVLEYDRDNDPSLIEDNIDKMDFIVHLAGVNRPEKTSEFYAGNVGSIEGILSILKERKLKIPVILTSSVHAQGDTDYGKSKKQAEDAVLAYGNGSVVYRLNNVFGKWCRPNYNSAVATFCDGVANDKEITVNDRKTEVELIYIDDVVDEIVRVVRGNKPSHKKGNYCFVKPSYKVSLGYIVDLLRSFKESISTPFVPNVGDEFVKKLYATFISYVPLLDLAVSLVNNVDERGSFVELVKTKESGQFSISFSKPNVIRGNHYHHTKIERFMVIKGKAKISFRHIIENTTYEIVVDDSDVKTVTIPPGYTHRIENIGGGEMILMIWCNELFDKDKPDTYFMDTEVKKEKK